MTPIFCGDHHTVPGVGLCLTSYPAQSRRPKRLCLSSRDRLKDALGDDIDAEIYSVEPRNFLVIGNLTQIKGNDDKIACFELFRRNVRSPEILTFDELYYRAKCIVDNISHEVSEPEASPAGFRTVDDDIPF
jgi:Domain of unknown function (DUF4263)